MLALVVLKDWHISRLDVKGAYISIYMYSDLKEKIYMEFPEGFASPELKGKVLLLHKVLHIWP